MEGGAQAFFADAIPPMMGKYCDIGHIIDPLYRTLIDGELYYHERPLSLAETSGAMQDSPPPLLSFDHEARTFIGGHLLKPGRYRLHLRVAGSNCRPKDQILELSLKEAWVKPEEIFVNGVKGLLDVHFLS